MGLHLLDLSEPVRSLMLEELDRDATETEGTIYISAYLAPEGARRYPELLRDALREGNDESLARELSSVVGAFEQRYPRRTRSGGMTMASVPSSAPRTLAEGEFNRYYIRGLCRWAISGDDSATIEVYRARPSSRPRSESEALIGRVLGARSLLDDLRHHIGEEPSLLPYVNSGLSVRLTASS